MALTALELSYCRAEEKDFKQLVAVMSKVLRDGDSLHADKYDSTKWYWKYFALPHAKPQIYICKEGESILGYYHCPVYEGKIKGEHKRFAVVQDVGVSEAARGKGVFRKLAEYANAQLMQSEVNVVYTFPNGKSIHTFLKYNGYSKIETFSTFVLPVKVEHIIASKIRFLNIHKLIGVAADVIFNVKTASRNTDFILEQQATITAEMVELFLAFNAQFLNSLTRDYAYLHWRYEIKPQAKHYFFTLRKGEKLEACVVLSVEDLLGCKALVVLDFATVSNEAFAQLMAEIRKNAPRFFDENIGMFYTSVSNTNNDIFLKSGFVKIPEKLNPRALNLLGKNITEQQVEVLNSSNWNFTLSDWDVL